ncbi:MAG TPA: MFS transporter [Pseudolabrys sp.]|nr:MFS transporter [Pseudolabrys sp.]
MTDTVLPSIRLTQQRPFVLLCIARLFSTLGYQALTVAIGWSIYDITHNAFDLGLVGLIQFMPAVVFTLAIGHIADRYDRRLIVRIAQGVSALAAITVIAALAAHVFSLALLFGAVFLVGCARAFEVPTAHALMPVLVPQSLLSRAVAGWNTANQTAVICGPALGGLIYAVSPPLVCVMCLLFFTTAITLVTLVKVDRPPPRREPPTLSSVLAGIRFVRSRARLLGVISLDLFVTLLGGVTALLPIYAHDILDAGPTGLGLLRSAPAIGALSMSILLARFPVERKIGIKMFSVVALYGLATIVFSLSTSLPLSMVALAVLGASDSISVVIRFSLVQIETPDAMRGRVTAINSLFVGTSNTLGEFESGMLAGLIGAMPAAFLGGLGSLLVAGIWMWLFPALRQIDRFQPAEDAKRV